MTVVNLSEHDVDRIAGRVVELLVEQNIAGPHLEQARFVGAKELASILGVSEDAVRASAHSLGALRVGKRNSKRARLVFDLRRLEQHEQPLVPSSLPASRARNRASRTDGPLLPIGSPKERER